MKELTQYFNGLGWDPIFVEGTDPKEVHPLMAAKLDEAIEKIQAIQKEARSKSAEEATMPHWPVLVVRTPKGWTGPKGMEPLNQSKADSVLTKFQFQYLEKLWNTSML